MRALALLLLLFSVSAQGAVIEYTQEIDRVRELYGNAILDIDGAFQVTGDTNSRELTDISLTLNGQTYRSASDGPVMSGSNWVFDGHMKQWYTKDQKMLEIGLKSNDSLIPFEYFIEAFGDFNDPVRNPIRALSAQESYGYFTADLGDGLPREYWFFINGGTAVSEVPEPATLGLLGVGLVLIGLRRRII